MRYQNSRILVVVDVSECIYAVKNGTVAQEMLRDLNAH